MTVTPSRLVLWIVKPSASSKLPRPKALFSAASVDDCHQWRLANRWADAVPLVRWNRDNMGAPYAMTSAGLWSVDNAPQAWIDRLGQMGEVSGGLAMHQLILSAHDIAKEIDGPIWEIQADASAGLLAIGAASSGPNVVALARGVPGTLTANAAGSYGVSVTERAVSSVADPLNIHFRRDELSDTIGAEDGPDGDLAKKLAH